MWNEVLMSTLAEHPPEITMASDDFQALEERVLRTVELLKGERELRFSVEQHASRLNTRVEEQSTQIVQLEEQIAGLKREREAVRVRIERLLKQIDEVGE
jgi:chromosome segregation ATPase